MHLSFYCIALQSFPMTQNNSQAAEAQKQFPVTDDIREAMALIARGTDTFLIQSEFEQKLARSKATGEPLRCKLGLDPTAPDIHIGHTVVLNKLRQLQDLGHTVIFLVGDFTAAIGDPSGRNTTRPPLTREQIEANAQTYLNQAGMVLDLDKTEVRYNSEWSNALGVPDFQVPVFLFPDLPLQGNTHPRVHEALLPQCKVLPSPSLMPDIPVSSRLPIY